MHKRAKGGGKVYKRVKSSSPVTSHKTSFTELTSRYPRASQFIIGLYNRPSQDNLFYRRNLDAYVPCIRFTL